MITLSPSQQNVVDNFPAFLLDDQPEMTISGFAGSGKSFLVKYLADMGGKQQKLVKLLDNTIPIRKLHFTATTNKAAEVLHHFLQRQTFTIHSLLGLKVRNDYKTGKVHLTPGGRETNLTNSIVFIDEASMINRDLLKIIRERARNFPDCKLIFIGDKYQLPPVMEEVCPVFDDSTFTFFLKEIQRQVASNPIIQLSAKYRECLDDHTKPWPIIQGNGSQIIHYEDKIPFFNEIKKQFLAPHDPDDCRIVAWSNNRVREYNDWIRRLQGHYVPYVAGDTVITNKPIFYDRTIVAQTDSVHTIVEVQPHQEQLISGYSIRLKGLEDVPLFQPHSWLDANKLANTLNADAKKTKNWEPYFTLKEQWTDLRPIHASTVHKAQGSTFREVFVDINNIGRNNRWREVARLVYVAITRASDTVHIYGKLDDKYTKTALVDLMEPFKNVQTT